MNIRVIISLLALGPAIAAGQVAQPAIRQVDHLDRIAPDSIALQSVGAVLGMPGGRVLVNDVRGRRLLLFDSTLSRARVVADTTDATAEAYGQSWATLARYRGDSALLIVPSTLSMFVVSPAGALARTMAIPRPDDAQMLNSSMGMPTVDARNRLVYFGGRGVLQGITMLGRGMPMLENGQPTRVMSMLQRENITIGHTRLDSSVVVRLDLDARTLDTAAWIHIPKFDRTIKVDDHGNLVDLETTPDPLPLIDLWTVLRNGTLAIVRARDFHLDLIDAAGHMRSMPKMPFEWRRVDDARKQTLIDSAVAFRQAEFDRVAALRASGGARPGGGGSGGRGGGAGGTGGRGGGLELAPNIAVRPALSDLPDYFPPVAEHGLSSDWDDRLWIETTTLVDGRPVYDIVNTNGDLVARAQLPSHRVIAGFGPGVIYMAVTEAAGRVRLERAAMPSR